MAAAGSKEAKQLEQIKNTFDKAYKEMGKASEADSNLATEVDSDTESRTKYDMSEDKGLYKYIKDALSGKLSKKSFYKLNANISDRLANDIEKIVGFSVKGYSNEISPGNIEHIDKRHGTNGIQDRSMSDLHELAKIGYVIENYDKIREGAISYEYKNSDNTFSKTIELQKKIDNEYYYVVEAVPDAKTKTLHVISAYKNKKDTFSEVAVSKDPSRYVQDEPQSNVSSKESIRDNNENSNTKYSLSDNQGRQLTKEQKEYFKDSKVRDENGNLLTVFHGSKNKFNEFTSDINWFSSSKEYSDNYGKKANLFNKVTKTELKKSKVTFETYLDIKNPNMAKDEPIPAEAEPKKTQS